MQDFKQLMVWEKAHQLTLNIYKVTALFPKEEIYGLTSQIKRASASIALNIAEGCGRGSDVDFKRFLIMSMGSANEVEYCLILARDINYICSETFEGLQTQIEEVKKMLSTFIRKLK